MHKIRSFKQNIRVSFIRYTVLMFGIMMVICLLAFFCYKNFVVEKRIHNDSEYFLNKIENQIGKYHDYLLDISKNQDVLSYFEDRKTGNKIYNLLYGFNNLQEIKSVFYVLDTDGKVLLTNALGKTSPDDYFQINDSYLFRQINQRPQEVIYDTIDIGGYDYRQTSYAIGKAVKADNQLQGFIIFELQTDDFKEMILGGSIDMLVVTDQFGTVIATTDFSVADRMNKFQPDIHQDHVNINDMSYYIVKTESKLYPIQQFALYSLRSHQELLRFFLFFFLLVPAMMCLVGYFLSDQVSHKNAESIQEFMKAVKAPTLKNLGYRIHIKSGDEFEIIARQYNKMMQQLQSLIKQVEESNERRRIAEIKHLEEQFNPHFIFNVLESLKCMVLTEQDKFRIMNMITALARLMRYSINVEKSMVAIEDDIKYIHDYLAVQKERFGDRLLYSIEIEKDLSQQIIPKLIIQPIVENSIKYGYESKEILQIKVKVERHNDKICLIVEDDGDGIEAKVLDELLKLLNGEVNVKNSTHIGLYNVHRRLQLVYGSTEAGISINSVPKKGTTVMLTIPYREV